MKVSILKASDYTDREIQRVVDAHFSLLGADRDIRRDMKVLLKPNLVMKRDPESATTTHPAFVKAVIRHLEGPVSYTHLPGAVGASLQSAGRL